KLHNATWPGFVGKGEGSEPIIPLDDLLNFTVNAEVDGVKFDGIDIGLFEPHFNIDATDDELKKLADRVGELGLNIGSLVAPIWPPTGGSAMGSADDRKKFVEMVRKAARFGQKLKDYGVRHYGVIRVDSATDPASWEKDPVANTKLIARSEEHTSELQSRENLVCRL